MRIRVWGAIASCSDMLLRTSIGGFTRRCLALAGTMTDLPGFVFSRAATISLINVNSPMTYDATMLGAAGTAIFASGFSTNLAGTIFNSPRDTSACDIKLAWLRLEAIVVTA